MADSHAPETILIVDDERGPRESLRMILASNYHVLQAQSGAEALERVRSERVDLITLDLNMPGMHGQELMRSVRSEFPQIEIVIITGCGSIESAAEGIRAGICDYIQKPFDVLRVSAAVDRALCRKRARERVGRVFSGLRDRDALAATVIDEPRTLEFLEVLAETIEVEDRFMRGHARRGLVILESGACDIDPEIVADAVSDAHSKIQSADSATEIGARR